MYNDSVLILQNKETIDEMPAPQLTSCLKNLISLSLKFLKIKWIVIVTTSKAVLTDK